MERKRTRLAILSVSAGAGHVRAAEAIRAAAERWYPGVEPVHIDVMDLVPKLFRKSYADSYVRVVQDHPAFWGYMYARTDRQAADSALNRMRSAVERLNTRKFMRTLESLKADLVVTTHFLPAQLLSARVAKGSFDRPVWVQVTDFDVHAMWVHERMTGYFVANDEVAWRLAERGIPAETIRVTGIPVMPAFGEAQSRAERAAELGIDPSRKTLLLMSGGAGIAGIEVLAERLLRMEADIQVIALAGRNAALLAQLRDLAARHPGRLFPMGFTRTVEQVMACADLAITKSGGLTTSECLAMGLPMIVVSPIPGQEERNADFLLENGAALIAADASAMVFRVKRLLAEPERLDALRANARKLGRPDAARQVLETVLGVRD
jgi:processive 1,2-diacylglycerol beta-glucosyltransferase